MSFKESVTVCLQKYATFSGRASRSEYWWFLLFCVIVNVTVTAVFGPESGLRALAGLLLLLPGLAVGSRRLHDIGRSGWWLLLFLIPVLGSVILLVLFCMPTKPETFRFADGEVRARYDSGRGAGDTATSDARALRPPTVKRTGKDEWN